MSSTHQMASSDDPAGVKPVEYDDTNVQNIIYMFEYSIYYLIIGLKHEHDQTFFPLSIEMLVSSFDFC